MVQQTLHFRSGNSRGTKYKLQVTSYKLKVARVFKYREAAQPHFGEAEIR